MYQAPDFVKVSTKVEDVFATYSCTELQKVSFTKEAGPDICMTNPTVDYTYSAQYASAPYQCYTGKWGA